MYSYFVPWIRIRVSRIYIILYSFVTHGTCGSVRRCVIYANVCDNRKTQVNERFPLATVPKYFDQYIPTRRI